MMSANDQLTSKLLALEAGQAAHDSLDPETAVGFNYVGLFTKVEFERLCAALKNNNKLRSFRLFLKLHSMTELHSNEMLDTFVTQLLISLSTCSNLIELVLVTDINAENGILLADVLRNNPKLIIFDLSTCAIQSEALLAISKPFSEATFIAQSKLEFLKLEHNAFDHQGLQVLLNRLMNIKSLTHLNLYNNNIGDEMTVEIYKLIIANPNLLNIELGETRISDQGVKNICDALTISQQTNPKPINLSLFGNSIGNEGFSVLTQLLKTQKVESLNVSTDKVDINESKVLELMCAANNNPYLLQILCFHLLKWGDEFTAKVANEFKMNSTLLSLNLGDVAVDAFLEMMGHNFILQAYTFAGLDSMAPRFRQLELHSALNVFLAEILDRESFPNISLFNQVNCLLNIKKLVHNKIIPFALLDLLTFVVDNSNLKNLFYQLKIEDKQKYLQSFVSVLSALETSSYQARCEEFLNSLQVDYIKDGSEKYYFNKLISICRQDALSHKAGNKNDLIPSTIILELPSLKELCLNVISLQIISSKIDVQTPLAQISFIAHLVPELLEELERVNRWRPNNEDHFMNKIRQQYISGMFYIQNKGVVLRPVVTEDINNNNNAEAQQRNKQNKIDIANDDTAIVPRYFQMK